MDIQYTVYDCKLKKIREMLLTTLEHNQHDVIIQSVSELPEFIHR
jgi:hypothetical protein